MTSIIERACRAICLQHGIDPDKQDIAVVRLDEVHDEVARRLVERVVVRKFGRRMRR